LISQAQKSHKFKSFTNQPQETTTKKLTTHHIYISHTCIKKTSSESHFFPTDQLNYIRTSDSQIEAFQQILTHDSIS